MRGRARGEEVRRCCGERCEEEELLRRTPAGASLTQIPEISLVTS